QHVEVSKLPAGDMTPRLHGVASLIRIPLADSEDAGCAHLKRGSPERPDVGRRLAAINANLKESAHHFSSGQSVQHSRCWSIGRGHATHSATPTSARNTAPKNTQVMADTPPRQPSA